MADFYDPYQQYWQGTPMRGNVKQPSGLAVLLNSVLGNIGPGYMQGVNLQNVRQEQALREQQTQTNKLQQQLMQGQMEFAPLERAMKVAQTFGAEDLGITPELRAQFQKAGIELPKEGTLSTLPEKRLENQLKISTANLAQKEKYRENLARKQEMLNERLKELNKIKQIDAETAREKNLISRESLALKEKLHGVDSEIARDKEKNRLIISKIGDLSVDKRVSQIMGRLQSGEKLTPGDEAALKIANQFRGAGAIISGDVREREGSADRVVKAKIEYSKEIEAVDSMLKRIHAMFDPASPMYKNIEREKATAKRAIWEKYRGLYPGVEFPEPGGQSAISGAAREVR